MTAAKSQSKPRKPSPTKPTPKAPAATAREPISAEPPKKARAAYAALLAEIGNAKHDELRGWDRRWEAIATILQKSYFLLEDDTPTALLWIKKHTDDSYRTGTRNSRVARYASPDEEQRYGITKLDLAITLAQTQHASKNPNADELKSIDFAALRYAIKTGSKSKKLSLADVSIEQLRELAHGKSKRDTPTASKPLSDSGAALSTLITAQKSLKNITLAEHDSELTLGKIRFDQLATLGRLLVNAKLG